MQVLRGQVSTRVNTTNSQRKQQQQKLREGRGQRQRGRKNVARVAVAQRCPGSLRTSLLEVFASAGGKAGSREWPSDAKAASSNTKVAPGDLESRQ